jgi:hypothetical protein
MPSWIFTVRYYILCILFYLGIPTAEELIKFVEDTLYPVTMLHNIESINNFTAIHDVRYIIKGR